jgi:16S rRNA (adenine1518-N6/adenine1519-N6)-dimethyltransferase
MRATPAREMLSKYGLAPSKRRGQNFLVDGNIVDKIVAAVGAGPDDLIVEVGPGFGAITFGLAETAWHVVGVEIDAGIARAFRDEYGEQPGITLVAGDVLDFDLGTALARYGGSRLVVVGNLPYNVTSPVVRLLIDHRGIVSRGVLMVQDEVGARMTAAPGESDYSSLTAVLAYHARVAPLFGVRRTCFHPKPKVDSRVVEVVFTGVPERRSDPDTYSEIVRAAFGQRRKMLRGSLAGLLAAAGTSPQAVETVTGIDLARRGESLSVEELDTLAAALPPAPGGSDGRGRR